MVKNTESKVIGTLLQLNNCGYSDLVLATTAENLHPTELLPTLVSEVVFILCHRGKNCFGGRLRHHQLFHDHYH